MNLPKEVLYHVLLNLPLQEVNKNCKLNKRFNSICQSKQFWIEYSNKHYWLKLPNDLNIEETKKLIIKAEKILKFIRGKNILVKYDSYLYIIFVMEMDDVNRMFEEMEPNIILNLEIEIQGLRYDKIYKYEKIPPRLEKGNNFTITDEEEFLNERGERNFNLILSNLTKPTLYTNGKELMVINYDVDFNYFPYHGQDPILYEMISYDIEKIIGDVYKEF